jgi:DNA helicase II / ATP-dependent DNA helicase PcrA
MKLKPSKYQKEIYKEISDGNDNILVQAVAGSGKTSTIVESLKIVPRYKKSIFLAFSKAIQLELDKRVPNHVDCLTLHSLGYKAISNHFRTRLKLDNYKNFKFSNDLVRSLTSKEEKPLTSKEKLIYQFTMSDLIDIARVNMDTSLDGFKFVEKNYDITCTNGEINNAINIFDQLSNYNKRRSKEKSIDYVDMLYLPVQLNLDMPQYDYVFVDEIQDLSNIQMELVSKILKPNGRIIGVGDEKQSIYGFQGAALNSMSILKDRFDMKELPLSVTYRVPKVGVENLKSLNPSIECSENAIEGVIRDGDLSDVQLGDLVICRNTKPLITAYFLLLSQEKKATVVGKEMEKGLLKIVNSLTGLTKGASIYQMDKSLEEVELSLSDQGIEEPRTHFKYQSLKEKIDIISLFLDKYSSIFAVKSKIEEIFHEDKSTIKLMTCHRSKGLESDRVFFITHFDEKRLIPSKYALTSEQKQQEKNLLYVAESRFKKEMIRVKLLH